MTGQEIARLIVAGLVWAAPALFAVGGGWLVRWAAAHGRRRELTVALNLAERAVSMAESEGGHQSLAGVAKKLLALGFVQAWGARLGVALSPAQWGELLEAAHQELDLLQRQLAVAATAPAPAPPPRQGHFCDLVPR